MLIGMLTEGFKPLGTLVVVSIAVTHGAMTEQPDLVLYIVSFIYKTYCSLILSSVTHVLPSFHMYVGERIQAIENDRWQLCCATSTC